MKYCIALAFLNIICNNAFILTHTIRLSTNTNLYKHRRSTLLMSNNSNPNSNTNSNINFSFSNMLLQKTEELYENILNNTDFTENNMNDYDYYETNNDDTINNTNDDNFPSFYEFIRQRNFKQTFNTDFKKININSDKYIINPSSKDLKLLTPFSVSEWARTWIYEMTQVKDYFPPFMFNDMFRMRDFGVVNNSKHYFYIGYYPSFVDSSKGPYYIGAFELNAKSREFITHIIIQNPFHCAENFYDKEKIVNYKKELQALCNDSFVFFKYSNLKNTKNERYYFSWLYDNI